MPTDCEVRFTSLGSSYIHIWYVYIYIYTHICDMCIYIYIHITISAFVMQNFYRNFPSNQYTEPLRSFDLKPIHLKVLLRFIGKGKAIPLQAWTGPQGSRKLRFPDFVTTAQDGGKVVSLTHRLPLPPGNNPGTHFCYRLSRPQVHSAIGKVLCQWKIHWHQLGSNQRPSDLWHSTLTTVLPRSLLRFMVGINVSCLGRAGVGLPPSYTQMNTRGMFRRILGPLGLRSQAASSLNLGSFV